MHICLGVAALPLTDRRRFAVSVLNNILGGGMSSRLFQNIRERQGLAYAIFSEMNSYRDTGALSVYAGTSLDTAAQVVRSVLDEFRRMKEEPLDEEELAPRQGPSEGRHFVGARRQRRAHEQPRALPPLFQPPFLPEELIAMLESVTAEEVQQLAREFFEPSQVAASVVGNLNGFKLTRENLAF